MLTTSPPAIRNWLFTEDTKRPVGRRVVGGPGGPPTLRPDDKAGGCYWPTKVRLSGAMTYELEDEFLPVIVRRIVCVPAEPNVTLPSVAVL